jgi:hypothetical protein
MVGNVWEWVGGWGDLSTGCTNWDAAFGDDMTCVGPNAPESAPAGLALAPKTDIFPLDPRFPGAVIRGGNFDAGTRNGVFAIYGGAPPSQSQSQHRLPLRQVAVDESYPSSRR